MALWVSVAYVLSVIHRNEFRAWTDIKPVKPIKARSQYRPPGDKMFHETSYSAQFKGEANKPTSADNKAIDRRRIRSLYSEPFKEPPKVRVLSTKNKPFQEDPYSYSCRASFTTFSLSFVNKCLLQTVYFFYQ